MPRIAVFGLVMAIAAVTAYATPAQAERVNNEQQAYSLAAANFEAGDRNVQLVLSHMYRDIYDWRQFELAVLTVTIDDERDGTRCEGRISRSDLYGRFHIDRHGARLLADVPISCNGSSASYIHSVEVEWLTTGKPETANLAKAFRCVDYSRDGDPIFKGMSNYMTIDPNVTRASLSISGPYVSARPVYTSGRISIRQTHSVFRFFQNGQGVSATEEC